MPRPCSFTPRRSGLRSRRADSRWEPIIGQLPAAAGDAHAYEEVPLRGTWRGIVKGFSYERIGVDSGQLAHQALVWKVEIVNATIDGVG